MPPPTTIKVRIDAEGVATITLDRPEARNALNRQMVDDLHAALGDLEPREDLRGLVVTSTGGKAFMSGADIAELRDRRRVDAWQGINTRLFARVEAFPRPTVAAIDGFCLGGGLELALACDFRVATEGSRFGQPEVGLGIIAGAGGTRRLPALVGLAAARWLLFTGEIVGSEEAHRMGLLDQVVPAGEALGAARALLAPILAQSPEAVRRTKQALLAWVRGASAEELLRLECSIQADLFEHPDKFARMDAFLARRKPRGGASPGGSAS